jgi:hypothetical protein
MRRIELRPHTTARRQLGTARRSVELKPERRGRRHVGAERRAVDDHHCHHSNRLPGHALGFGTLTWSTLGNADDGNTYLMTRCQAILVEVLNSATDPCHWTTVQTTDSRVMTLLPIPLPGLPPPGGTLEVYAAISSGQAMLTSTLSCPDGSTEQNWSVSVDVTG